jgi:hypothetical protein
VIERKRVMITEAGYMALRDFPESPDEEKACVSYCVREPEPISLIITSLRDVYVLVGRTPRYRGRW